MRDEEGVTVHLPLVREPMRLRPDGTDAERNYYGPSDERLRQDLWGFQPETVDHWRARLDAADREVLDEVLRDLEVTDYERRWLSFQSRGERSDVVVLASLLDRMYRAGRARGVTEGIAQERERRRKYEQTKRTKKGRQA